jgi:hypothetical protein
MNQIYSALEAGYSPERILKYIQKIDPDLAIKVNTALQAGHSIEQVLSFVSKNGKNISKVFDQGKEERGNIYQEARKSVHPALKGAGMFAGALLGGGAGAYALSRAVPQAIQGSLLPALPKSPIQALQIEGQAAKQLPFIEGEAQAIKPPPSPMQAPTAQQAPIASQAPIEISPLPEALQKQASAMLEAGNNPEQIENALKHIQPKIVKEYEKSTNTPIRSAIEEFSKSLPAKEQAQPMGTGVQETQQPIETKVSEPVEEKPKVEERKKVALPNGDIGEITNIRQGIATVNANGKEYRRKLDELIESPLPQKELDELYEDLSKGIEAKTGEEISRMANLVGYDAKERALIFHPTGPKAPLYGYLKLNDEEVKELMETQALRKTSGENYVGAWKEGTKSVYGSKLSAFIRKLQESRGGKGSEYGFKFDLLYDAMEPAKVAKKEKFDQKQAAISAQKKAEKEKAKKEKENDKKRKAKKPRPD